jgi:hypothetical protein
MPVDEPPSIPNLVHGAPTLRPGDGGGFFIVVRL